MKRNVGCIKLQNVTKDLKENKCVRGESHTLESFISLWQFNVTGAGLAG